MMICIKTRRGSSTKAVSPKDRPGSKLTPTSEHPRNQYLFLARRGPQAGTDTQPLLMSWAPETWSDSKTVQSEEDSDDLSLDRFISSFEPLSKDRKKLRKTLNRLIHKGTTPEFALMGCYLKGVDGALDLFFDENVTGIILDYLAAELMLLDLADSLSSTFATFQRRLLDGHVSFDINEYNEVIASNLPTCEFPEDLWDIKFKTHLTRLIVELKDRIPSTDYRNPSKTLKRILQNNLASLLGYYSSPQRCHIRGLPEPRRERAAAQSMTLTEFYYIAMNDLEHLAEDYET